MVFSFLFFFNCFLWLKIGFWDKEDSDGASVLSLGLKMSTTSLNGEGEVVPGLEAGQHWEESVTELRRERKRVTVSKV